MMRKTTPILVAVVIAALGASAADAAGTYQISRTSAATNAKIAREIEFGFTTNGTPVIYSYSVGAVLTLPHRLSDGTVKVWAGVTKPTATQPARLVLANGGYYSGSAPNKFGWALADSGTAPSDPALTSAEFAALTNAVGYAAHAPAPKRTSVSCKATLTVGNPRGIQMSARSLRAQGTKCGNALGLVHDLMHKEIYGHPQEACVTGTQTSRGCRVDGWVCRQTGPSGPAGWGPVECIASAPARLVLFSQHSSSMA